MKKNYNSLLLESLDKVFRLNLINSITGIKPANLIGTTNKHGDDNLAIFSSIVHISSNPPLIGFISRLRGGQKPNNTVDNILKTRKYTINAVPTHMIKEAHNTSGKHEQHLDEFEICKINKTHIDQFEAPFVANSPIKIGMLFKEAVPINSNNALLIIGQVDQLIIDKNIVNDAGQLNLELANLAGISGLNAYYKLSKLNEFDYVKV